MGTLALPTLAKLRAANDATLTHLDALIRTRSKTAIIPKHIREKMVAFKSVQAWWASEAGQKVLAGLSAPATSPAKARPATAKTRSAAG